MTKPIFHLSFPVYDLEASLNFYQRALDAIPGRREEAWADLALFGAQITLQHAPQDINDVIPRTCHFGATLDWMEWEELVARLENFVEGPRIEYEGTDREQAKAMITDPTGNLIELKAYRRPIAVLGSLVGQ